MKTEKEIKTKKGRTKMKNKITHLVFVIDQSGSMSSLESDTIGGFNSMIKEQKAVAGEALVTTVLFDDEYKLLHDRVDIQKVAPMTENDYVPRGATALLDAVGKTIEKIRKAQKEKGDESFEEKVMFFHHY